MKQTQIIKNPFLIGFIAYLILGALILFNYEKGSFELLINQKHTSVCDYLFIAFTYLGDGITLSVIIAIILWSNVYRGILSTTAYLLSTAITQFLKRVVFADHMRPLHYFGQNTDIHYVEGLEIHVFNSFPSGHTSAAFCVFGVLAFYYPKHGFLLFVASVLVGFSRVYLMQHFIFDIYFGSMVGIGSGLITWLLFEHQLSAKTKLSVPLSNLFSYLKNDL